VSSAKFWRQERSAAFGTDTEAGFGRTALAVGWSHRGNSQFGRKSQETDMNNLMARFVREEEGQDIIEYALLAAFISIAAYAFLQSIGANVKTIYQNVDTAAQNAATASS
jgi:pilus assembly protein Flp/PilA